MGKSIDTNPSNNHTFLAGSSAGIGHPSAKLFDKEDARISLHYKSNIE
jgi:hypothetical protein